MDSQAVFTNSLHEHRAILDALDVLVPDMVAASNLLSSCLAAGKAILLAGNGGSASDAQHIAGELVGRFLRERMGAPAIALSGMDATLTSIANDYGYEHVYSRQIEAFRANSGVFIGLSTSGNSPNILLALNRAREFGMKTIGFTGESGGKMALACDVCLCVPSSHTPRIQEIHILLGHILCEIVEKNLE